ncbi:unnamed protein product, partial [Adineta steineri]
SLNIAKAIQLFAAKCEQSICTDSEGSQVVSAPTPAQLRNISAINILYNFCSMITKMQLMKDFVVQQASKL